MFIPALGNLLGIRFLAKIAQGFASRSFAGGIYHQLTGSAIPSLGKGATGSDQAGYALGRLAAHATNAAVALSHVNIVNTEYYQSLGKYSTVIGKATARLGQARVFNEAYYAQRLGESYSRYTDSVIGRDIMARSAITDWEKVKLETGTWLNKALGGWGFAYGAWKRAFAEGGIFGAFGKLPKAVDDEKKAMDEAVRAQNIAVEWIFDLGRHYRVMQRDSYVPRGPGGKPI